MSNKLVDGVELLRMAENEEIEQGTIIKNIYLGWKYEYFGSTFRSIEEADDNDEMTFSEIIDEKFEILLQEEVEQEIDIQAIKELDPCATIPDGMNGTKLYYSVQEGLIIKQQNKIIKAIKQLDKRIK